MSVTNSFCIAFEKNFPFVSCLFKNPINFGKSVLAGKNGYRVYEKTADGYVRTNGILKTKDAVNGKDIYLTLNSSLQRDLDLSLIHI